MNKKGTHIKTPINNQKVCLLKNAFGYRVKAIKGKLKYKTPLYGKYPSANGKK